MRIMLLFAFAALAGYGDHVGNAAAGRAATPSVRSTAVTPIPWTSALPVHVHAAATQVTRPFRSIKVLSLQPSHHVTVPPG
jgi:hypothetical protein